MPDMGSISRLDRYHLTPIELPRSWLAPPSFGSAGLFLPKNLARTTFLQPSSAARSELAAFPVALSVEGIIMHYAIKALALATVCFGMAGCKVNKTQEGKLPDVNVTAKGGQLPEYNVQGPKVEVGSKNTTVEVPTVKVKTP